ncbi:G-protein coupled receptor moody, partial [Melipona quadrifasciata]
INLKMDKLATWHILRASGNSTENALIDGEVSRFPKSLQTFAAVVAILIMITGLAGNLLTIIALCKYPKVRNVAAAFIISLCVADFVFCLLVLPFDSIRFIDASWANVRFLCILVPFLRYGNVGIYYDSSPRFVQQSLQKILDCIYDLILLVVLLWDASAHPLRSLGSETRMRKHTAPTIKSPHTPGRDTREIKQRRSEWRITKMVLAIFLSFVACYLPITIVKVADVEVRYPAFHVLGYLLLYFASCVNPIIYVIMNKQYRQAYAGVIGCSRIRASLSPYGSSAPGHQQQDYGQGNFEHRRVVTKL